MGLHDKSQPFLNIIQNKLLLAQTDMNSTHEQKTKKRFKTIAQRC